MPLPPCQSFRDFLQLFNLDHVSHCETPPALGTRPPTPRAGHLSEGFSYDYHPRPSQGEPGHPGLNTPCDDLILNEFDDESRRTEMTMMMLDDVNRLVDSQSDLNSSTRLNSQPLFDQSMTTNPRRILPSCSTSPATVEADRHRAQDASLQAPGHSNIVAREETEAALPTFEMNLDLNLDLVQNRLASSPLSLSSSPSLPSLQSDSHQPHHLFPFSAFVMSPTEMMTGEEGGGRALDRQVSVPTSPTGVIESHDFLSQPPTDFLSYSDGGLGPSTFDHSYPFELSSFEPLSSLASVPFYATTTTVGASLAKADDQDHLHLFSSFTPSKVSVEGFPSLSTTTTTVGLTTLGGRGNSADPITLDQSLDSPLGLDKESPFSELLLASPMFDEEESLLEVDPSSGFDLTSSELARHHQDQLDYSSLFGSSATNTVLTANGDGFTRSMSTSTPSPTPRLNSCSPLVAPTTASNWNSSMGSSSSSVSYSVAPVPVHVPSYLLPSQSTLSSTPSTTSSSTSASNGPVKPTPTGFRGMDSSSLVRLDAPVQPRKYVVPSSTSRKRKTVAAERELAKRHQPSVVHPISSPHLVDSALPISVSAPSSSSSSAAEKVSAKSKKLVSHHEKEEEKNGVEAGIEKMKDEKDDNDDDDALPEDLVAAVERKRLQNTMSARKSRIRKQERLGELEGANQKLKEENELLKNQLKVLTGLLLNQASTSSNHRGVSNSNIITSSSTSSSFSSNSSNYCSSSNSSPSSLSPLLPSLST